MLWPIFKNDDRLFVILLIIVGGELNRDRYKSECKTLPLAAIQFFIYFKEELNSDKTLAVNNKRSTYDTNLQLNHIMFIYRIFAANLLINVTLSIKFKKAKYFFCKVNHTSQKISETKKSDSGNFCS